MASLWPAGLASVQGLTPYPVMLTSQSLIEELFKRADQPVLLLGRIFSSFLKGLSSSLGMAFPISRYDINNLRGWLFGHHFSPKKEEEPVQEMVS